MDAGTWKDLIRKFGIPRVDPDEKIESNVGDPGRGGMAGNMTSGQPNEMVEVVTKSGAVFHGSAVGDPDESLVVYSSTGDGQFRPTAFAPYETILAIRKLPGCADANAEAGYLFGELLADAHRNVTDVDLT